jgi:hypothetical protein
LFPKFAIRIIVSFTYLSLNKYEHDNASISLGQIIPGLPTFGKHDEETMFPGLPTFGKHDEETMFPGLSTFGKHG